MDFNSFKNCKVEYVTEFGSNPLSINSSKYLSNSAPCETRPTPTFSIYTCFSSSNIGSSNLLLPTVNINKLVKEMIYFYHNQKLNILKNVSYMIFFNKNNYN
jgi:hypothetical protein